MISQFILLIFSSYIVINVFPYGINHKVTKMYIHEQLQMLHKYADHHQLQLSFKVKIVETWIFKTDKLEVFSIDS